MVINKLKISVILMLFLNTNLCSQSSDILSKSIVPKEVISQNVYVEKYEAISHNELNQAIDAFAGDTVSSAYERKKNEIIENMQFFNAYLYRKTNQEIDNMIYTYGKSTLSALHKRDIEESDVNLVRFVIRSDNSFTDLKDFMRNVDGFYIYDRKLKTRYTSVASVDILVKLMSQAKIYLNISPKVEKSQEQLDLFLLKKIPKPRVKKKRGGGAVFFTIGGVIWAAISIIPNVVENG